MKDYLTMKVGLAGGLGGILAVLSDLVQKEQASAILKIAYTMETSLLISFPPLIAVFLVVGLAIGLCFVFEPETKAKAFYVGASILTIMMTLVPYELPQNLPINRGEVKRTNSTGTNLLYEYITPKASHASSNIDTSKIIRVGLDDVHMIRISLTTEDNKTVKEGFVAIYDLKSKQQQGISKIKGNVVEFLSVYSHRDDREDLEQYKVRVEVPGYRISERIINSPEDYDERGFTRDLGELRIINMELKLSRTPLVLQRLLKY